MSPRARFVLRRTLLSIALLFAMSLFVFLMIHPIPADPVRTMLGRRRSTVNPTLELRMVNVGFTSS